MTGPVIDDGWLKVGYDGHDMQAVELGIGDPPEYAAAFLDWHDGERVAMIRPPEQTGAVATVWLRVGGYPTRLGRVII